MRTVILAITLLTIQLGAPARESAKIKLSQAEAERFVFQSWRRVATEEGGKSRDSEQCVQFSAKGPEWWSWQGELVSVQPDPGERIEIDPTTEPMRIDFVSTRSDQREAVKPCIWKVEGSGANATLVIVKPHGSAFVRKDKGYDIRPTGFTATKENQYTKDTYVRCEYLEQFDVGIPKKKDGKAAAVPVEKR